MCCPSHQLQLKEMVVSPRATCNAQVGDRRDALAFTPVAGWPSGEWPAASDRAARSLSPAAQRSARLEVVLVELHNLRAQAGLLPRLETTVDEVRLYAMFPEELPRERALRAVGAEDEDLPSELRCKLDRRCRPALADPATISMGLRTSSIIAPSAAYFPASSTDMSRSPISFFTDAARCNCSSDPGASSAAEGATYAQRLTARAVAPSAGA